MRGRDVLLRNQTLSTRPEFVVTRLRAASLFDARVYASNRRGRSEAVVLRVSTLKAGPGGERVEVDEEEVMVDNRLMAATAVEGKAILGEMKLVL